jgi:predicted permease
MRAPVFALVAGLVLSVGIGLNLTVFQLGSALFLRPLPVEDPDSLVRFDRVASRFRSNETPYSLVPFIAQQRSVLSAVMTHKQTTLVWGDGYRSQSAAFVSSNWFAGLGVGALQGRTLQEGVDNLSGAAPAVVISDYLWIEDFGSDPGVIGSVAMLNGRSATIVGIVASGVEGVSPGQPHVWIPIEQVSYFLPGNDWMTRMDTGPELYARLSAGVSLSAAREALRPVMANVAEQFGLRPGQWLEPLSASTRFRDPALSGNDQTFLLFFGFLTALTLLVACANLGNLVLSRNIARTHELSVRMALGANRAAVIRHLLGESIVLVALGSVGGLFLSRVALDAFLATTPIALPTAMQLDWRTGIASLTAGLLTVAVVGLLPALRLSRASLDTFLKSGSYGATRGSSHTRMSRVMLGLQVTCSCVLLVVGGLTVREMRRTTFQDRETFESVAVMEARLDQFGLRSEAAREYWRTMQAALSGAPVVDRVALLESSPFGQTSDQTSYEDAPGLGVVSNRVDSSYFDLFRIPVLAGRTFRDDDAPRSTVIISRRLAERMYGSADAVGKPFPKNQPTASIVAVVADAEMMSSRERGWAQVYWPPRVEEFDDYSMVVRAKGDVAAVLSVLKTVAQSVDSNIVPRLYLIRDDYAQKVRVDQTLDLTLIAMGLVALTIAALGILGVVAHSVALRQREIEIRLAVGATGRAILILVLADSLKPVVAGLLAGLGVSVAVRQILNGAFGLKGLDLQIVSGVVVVLLGASLLVGLVPAVRSLRMSAVAVLRDH